MNEIRANKDGETGPMNGKEDHDEMNTFENPGSIKGDELESEKKEKEKGEITGHEEIDEIDIDAKQETPDKQELEGIEEIRELEGGDSSKIKVKVKFTKITDEKNETPDNGKIDMQEIAGIEKTKAEKGGDKEAVNEVLEESIHGNTNLEESTKIEENDAMPKCGLMTCPLEAKYCKVETKSVPPDFSQLLKTFECLSNTHETLKAIERITENSEPGRYFKNFTTQPVIVDNQIPINLGDFWGQ